ncbi:MAG: GNAT family N-acetyltransferase [Elusimicrobia bacterium]|nr:GNAT family N-acetyltransferase [Elusimicrobiota bacterium]
MVKPLRDLQRAWAEHEERHRPTGFDFALSDSVDYLDGAAWDGIVERGSFFLQRRYLRVLERYGPANLKSRSCLVFKNRAPIAAIALQSIRVSGENVVSRRSVASGALSRLSVRAVVCGNVLSWGRHGVAFARGVDPSKAWPAVAEALYRLRRAERLEGQTDVVIVKDLFDGEAEGVESLARFSYKPLETEPNMILAISPQWRGYQDYLAALHSKYRKSAVRIERDLSGAGCSVERLDDVRSNSGELHELYLQVQAAAAVRPVAIHKDYLAAVAEAAAKDFICSVVRRRDRILGFVTTLRDDPNTAIGYLIGFDRALRDELPLYFALLQRVVADAMELGCRRISLGRTALEPKAKLGARPVATRVWARHSNPMVNVAVKRLIGAIPHDSPPERNPFRDPESVE